VRPERSGKTAIRKCARWECGRALVGLGLWAALLLVTEVRGFGQAGAGAIQGVVKDTTGAVIAAANVVIVHASTSREHQTTTNEVGFYAFPALQPGQYKFFARASGMQEWAGILLLQVAQTAVIDPALSVAATATGITVAGDVTPLVTTTSATLGNVVERARIEQLPLNGRFIQNLVALTTPGLEGEKVYGIRGAMEYTQDGAVLANREEGWVFRRPPGLDSVEEFRVETNGSAAKMSRPASTILATRSGTNQLHGALFETARNNSIGVARARQDYYTKPPHLVRNEFGASLGGPVKLPKIYDGTNRSFFFFSYEAYRNMSSDRREVTMPTMPMRQGNFSGLIDGQGRRITLHDPWTTDSTTWQRQPFPGNIIPIARQSPVAKRMLDVTPPPTTSDNPLVANNWVATTPNITRHHTTTVRFDQRLTRADQVFGRFTKGRHGNDSVANNWFPVTDNSANASTQWAKNYTAVGSWIHTFSPAFFGETLVTAAQEHWLSGEAPGGRLHTLGLPNPFDDPNYAGTLSNLGFTAQYINWPGRENISRIITVDQNFTKIRGKHEFQFGGRYRNERLTVLPNQGRAITMFNSLATALYDSNSGSAYTALPQTGHNAANFFLGIAGSYSVDRQQRWMYMGAPEYGLYFQDNFRVNSRLILNLGVRYDLYPPMRDSKGLFSGFDFRSRSIVIGSRSMDELYTAGATTHSIVQDYEAIGVRFVTAQETGMPSTIVKGNYLDFNPRLGFAYRLDSSRRSTVIRGGYSIFGYATNSRTFTHLMRGNPPFAITQAFNANSAVQSPDGRPNYLLRSAPGVIAGVNSARALDGVSGSATRGGFGVVVFDPDQPTMRAHEWNLTLEREIFQNTVLRGSYVGTHGSRLDQYVHYNTQPTNYVWFVATGQPLPTGVYANVARRPFDNTTYGDINVYGKKGWSNASAIKLEAERRYSAGYGFQFFYVMTNAFRSGGNSRYDDPVLPAGAFLPGAAPADENARNRLLNYRRDIELPKHRVRANWIVDLPFGRGKKFGSRTGGLLDRMIGGWQIAGFANFNSNYWALPTSAWGELGKVEVYGTKYPIEDCRSGACYQGYLYWNGYIPANRINSYDATGKPNGVMGVPAGYSPSSRPVIPTPADGGSRTDPNFSFYDTNTVSVPLKNGTLQRTTIDTSLHPWLNQYFAGPWTSGVDASLFKAIRINERFMLRFNADFFNLLNMPGMVQPDGEGILSLRNSAQTPRELQLTLRLSW